MAIAKKELKLEKSLYEILQILSVSAFEQMPVSQLIVKDDASAKRGESQNAPFLLGFYPDTSERRQAHRRLYFRIKTTRPNRFDERPERTPASSLGLEWRRCGQQFAFDSGAAAYIYYS